MPRRGALQAVQSRYLSGLVDVTVDARVVGFTVLIALAAGIGVRAPARSNGRALRPPDRPRGRRRSFRQGPGDRAGRGTSSSSGRSRWPPPSLVVAPLLARSFDALVERAAGLRSQRSDHLRPVRAAGPLSGRGCARALLPGRVAGGGGDPGRAGRRHDLGPPVHDGEPTGRPSAWRAGRSTRPPRPARTSTPCFPSTSTVMGIPLREGRIFDQAWEPVEDVPVVVNERLAHMVEPEGTAVGRAILLRRDETTIPLRIVGVVGDVLDDGYATAAEPIFYMPWGANPQRGMSVVVRVRRRRHRRHRRDPSRGSAGRSRRARGGPAYDGRDARRDRRAAAGGFTDRGGLRAARAPGGGSRHLRRAQLRGPEPHPGDRHPGGARCRRPAAGADGPRALDAPAGDRAGPRPGRRARRRRRAVRHPLRGSRLGPVQPERRDGAARAASGRSPPGSRHAGPCGWIRRSR